MRVKAIPPAPSSLAYLERVQGAVPLVPEPEASCCVRVATRLDDIDRGDARTWLAFMRALGLVARGDLGYTRTDVDVTPGTLREPFREGVFGVAEVLEAIADAAPMDADAAFEALKPRIPQWERHRNPNTWPDTWHERVKDMLAWAALLDLVETTPEGYVPAADDTSAG